MLLLPEALTVAGTGWLEACPDNHSGGCRALGKRKVDKPPEALCQFDLKENPWVEHGNSAGPYSCKGKYQPNIWEH